MTRILQVSQTYYPFLSEGGPPVKVRAIAGCLVSHGHRVAVLTANLGLFDTANRERAQELKLRRRWWGWLGSDHAVDLHYLHTLARRGPVTVNPTLGPWCLRHLRSFDAVHIYGLYDLLGPLVALFCRLMDVPYVLEPIGMYRPVARSLRAKRLYHFLIGRWLLNGARTVIATSDLEQVDLIEGGVPREKIQVRRNGVSPPLEVPQTGLFRSGWSIEPDRPLVLFLGRLTSKKSPELLIKAFAAAIKRASADRRRPILALAGPEEDREYTSYLRALVESEGVKDDVLFTGPVYDEQKWSAFRDATVFVLPSINENFGNTVAEAIACGTPVIVTDQCGVAPLVKGAGMVISHDLDELTEALNKLLGDPALRQRMTEESGGVTMSLDWDQPVREMEALYRGLRSHGGLQSRR